MDRLLALDPVDPLGDQCGLIPTRVKGPWKSVPISFSLARACVTIPVPDSRDLHSMEAAYKEWQTMP